MTDIDPTVYASYHWVSSQYHKSRQEFAEFYKNALLYLAYTSVESLSDLFKMINTNTNFPYCIIKLWKFSSFSANSVQRCDFLLILKCRKTSKCIAFYTVDIPTIIEPRSRQFFKSAQGYEISAPYSLFWERMYTICQQLKMTYHLEA